MKEGLKTGSPYLFFGVANNFLKFEDNHCPAALLMRRKCQLPSLFSPEKQLKTSHVDIS